MLALTKVASFFIWSLTLSHLTSCDGLIRGSRTSGIYDDLLDSRDSQAAAAAVAEDSSGDADYEIPLQRTPYGWYTAEILVGGVKTTFGLDTGSGVMWTRKAAGSNSSVAEAAQGSFSQQYGRGHVAGQVLQEMVSFGNQKEHSCSVGHTSEESEFFAKQQDIDGLLGLGCSGGLAAGAVQCLVGDRSTKGNHRTFSLQLRHDSGTMSVGSIPMEYQGNLVFMPPAQDCGHWDVPLQSLMSAKRFGMDQTDFLANSGPSFATLDSGSTGIVGPTFAVIALAEQLGATEGKAGDGSFAAVTYYRVPCDSRLSLTFVLGEEGANAAKVTLQGEDLISEKKDGASDCHLHLSGWDTESWILGRVFLQKLQAVVFNPEKKQVALAVEPNSS